MKKQSASLFKPIWAFPFKLIFRIVKWILSFILVDLFKGVMKTWRKPGKDVLV
jgi:hypothetical protein